MSIGESIDRKESWNKVTGNAKYTADLLSMGLLYARLCTSKVSHAKINNIDISKVIKIEGVYSVITGKDVPLHMGVLLEDRPPIAIDKIRYYGEVIAIVVAKTEAIAELACELIKVNLTELPVINNVNDALKPGAKLIHQNSTHYVKVVEDVYPEENSNIASSYKIRKGDVVKGFEECSQIVEKFFELPKSDHVAMETKVAEAEISTTGEVTIISSTQSPYTVKELISKYFAIDEGSVVIKVPLVGGGFGGKSSIFLESLAYIASQAVGGKKVRIIATREQEFSSSPSRLGLNAHIKIGADANGKIIAAEMRFILDSGAYTDISPNMSKAIAANCTGPYNIENLKCDSLCVYTNHNYSTAFRGFSHESYMFCVERCIDELAKKCNIDEFQFRLNNCIVPGNYSPTQIKITRSNAGNITACLEKLKDIINWQEGNKIDIGDNKVRVKGIATLWKAPNPSSDASAGAIITFNSAGSINLNIGAVEIGSGGQTLIAEMLADKLKMDYSRIFVELGVNTKTTPKYWKNVASLSSFLLGRAVMNAADDLIDQLKANASLVIKSPVEDLEVGGEKVFLKENPEIGIGFKDIVFGVKSDDGKYIGKQIIGRGSYIIGHISGMSEDTGKGKTGNSWTVGAQAVEVEVDLIDYTFRLIKAATVIDIGKLIDSKNTVSVIQGGMSMGLSLATNENIIYDNRAIPLNTSFRTYDVMHFGEEPRYIVDFEQTPQIDSPYGIRAFSEHGIIGIPAAFANAISTATGLQIDELPINAELIFKKKSEVPQN